MKRTPIRPLRWFHCWSFFFVLAFLAPAVAQSAPAPRDSKSQASDDVAKAVQEIAEDQIIHGTWVYSREKTLTEAEAETSSAYYGAWQGPGRVFYKVRRDALSPRHFKDSSDIGTITVRYIVQGVSPNRTHLQIDAVFVEDASRKVHVSDKTADALKQRQQNVEARAASKQRDEEIARLNSAESSLRDLQSRVHELRHDVEVRVKNQNTELKAAPFQRATKLQSLPANTEVVVEIITPYWYGVETVQGQRGWLRQDQVEPLP